MPLASLPLPWLAVPVLALLLAAGALAGWAAVLRRKLRRSQALAGAQRDQLALQAAVLDGIPQPVYVRDASQRLITCNRRYEELVGASRDTLRGLPLDARGHLSSVVTDMAELVGDYREVIASGKALSRDRCLRIHGVRRHVLNWVSPLRVGGGDGVTALVGGWMDLTERHDMLARLAEAKANAEAANRAKSTFLASISHEIRTPMHAISGMLELTLARSHLSQDDRQMLGTAYRSSRALLTLINDILDLSKMESGKFRMRPVPASLAALVNDVMVIFGPVGRQKHLPLTFAAGPEVGAAHLVDPLRFKQILGNLVSNAIRFTETGGIHIELATQPGSDGEQQVTLTVSDTGIGIATEDQQNLFQPFEQVHGSAQPQDGGTGLGLAICNRLVTAMGGRISLTSEPGQGTRVQVVLPLKTAAAPASPGPAATPAAGDAGLAHGPATLRVLVVDDHAPNRLLLQHQLEHLGQLVTTATDGRDALARLEAGSFDLVICDCAMPVMDGLAFTRAVRQRGDALGRIPIVGCTANALQADHEAAVRAGMNGVLVKPVDLRALAEALNTFARAQGVPPASATGSPLPWPAACPSPGTDEPPAASRPDRQQSWCEICREMNVQCERLAQDQS